jgi:hypothetical protein
MGGAGGDAYPLLPTYIITSAKAPHVRPSVRHLLAPPVPLYSAMLSILATLPLAIFLFSVILVWVS